MTEAEKAQFYATILAGILATAPEYGGDPTLFNERVVAEAIEIGDELRAQLQDKEPSPF